MLLELPRIGEAAAALLARVEFLPGVDLHVRLQLIGLVELPLTVQTFKRLLARVDPQVSVEVSVRSEGLAALVAFVRFLACVNALVLLQAPGVEESFPAHITDKRLLPRVASLMVAERVFVMERLATYAAVELLVLTVAFLVKFERVRRAETFQAYFAAERFGQGLVSPFGLQRSLCAVCLLVPVGVHVPLMDQQSAVEQEGLSAQVAHEGLPGAVDEHVGLEFGVLREALPALLAAERLLARVNAKVPLEVVVEAEPRAAYVAGEWLLPGVDQAVSLQGGARPVRPVAHGANERRDARVFPLVHGQGVGVLEGLVTHGAFVLFGVSVNYLVEAKGVFALEVLPARGAAEGPLVRVHGHVTFQLHRRLKCLVAMLALQRLLPLLVAQEVVLQGLLDSECFPTLIAGEWLRWFQPLVMLEVVLKRQLFPVRPLTVRTREGQRGFARFVTHEVIFQGLLLKETSTALLARETLLVDLCVFFQFTFPMKAEVAVLTGELLHCL